MAFVPPSDAVPENIVAVEVRGTLVKAKVVPTPFYKRVRNKPQQVLLPEFREATA